MLKSEQASSSRLGESTKDEEVIGASHPLGEGWIAKVLPCSCTLVFIIKIIRFVTGVLGIVSLLFFEEQNERVLRILTARLPKGSNGLLLNIPYELLDGSR